MSLIFNACLLSWCWVSIREFYNQRRRKNSRLSHLVHFVKCWLLSWIAELNLKGLYQRAGNEKESGCLVLTSSTKREIRQFHVVVVQWRWRNVQKSVVHVQICCFDRHRQHDGSYFFKLNSGELISFSCSLFEFQVACCSPSSVDNV